MATKPSIDNYKGYSNWSLVHVMWNDSHFSEQVAGKLSTVTMGKKDEATRTN